MKTVKIAELKDQLSRHLRAVEAGAEITVTDRNRPIARIVPVPPPVPSVTIIPARTDFTAVRDRPRQPATLDVSSTDLLLEERGDR
jgi:prevent-host-death family protein